MEEINKESDYISYEDIIKRNNHKRKLLKQGFKFVNRTNKYKKILAYVFIVCGAITLPLPTGSFILIGLGLGMLGLKKSALKRWFKILVYRKKAERGNKIK